MSDLEEIEKELEILLKNIDDIKLDDRLPAIMGIIKKKIEWNPEEFLLTYGDFSDIMSNAKNAYPRATIPMYLSKRPIDNTEVVYIMMMEAFIGFLNRKKIIKRLVKIDQGR